MNKIFFPYLILLVLVLGACKQVEIPEVDPRDALVGMYTGRMIQNEWGQSGTPGYSHSDTLFDYQMIVSKTGEEHLTFAPNVWFSGDTLRCTNQGVGMHWSGSIAAGGSYSKTVSFDTAQAHLVYLFQYDNGLGSGGGLSFDGIKN